MTLLFLSCFESSLFFSSSFAFSTDFGQGHVNKMEIHAITDHFKSLAVCFYINE